MTWAANSLLDLDQPARAEGFRFDLLDQSNSVQGVLTVDASSAVSIEHNTNRTIKRTMSGLRLAVAEAVQINGATDRVQPVMVLADGSEWPLGVFVFLDLPRARTAAGVVVTASLCDMGFKLDQAVGFNVTVPPSSPVRDWLILFLTQARVEWYKIAATGATTGATPMVWKASDTWAKVITDLAAVAGFHSPVFTHRGVCQIVPPPPASDVADPDVYYLQGQRIIDGSIVETDDTIDAPNRYVCVDTGGSTTEAPIAGAYVIPDAAPHSYAKRGYYVTKTVERQGVGSVDAAVLYAAAAYFQSRFTEGVNFSTPIDPRHDTWNVFGYAGGIYREQTWKIDAKPGGLMAHEGRRTYA